VHRLTYSFDITVNDVTRVQVAQATDNIYQLIRAMSVLLVLYESSWLTKIVRSRSGYARQKSAIVPFAIHSLTRAKC
jgi:hypothetical protein